MIAASAAMAIPMFATPGITQIKDIIKSSSVTTREVQHYTIKLTNTKITSAEKMSWSHLNIAGYDGKYTYFERSDGTKFYLDRNGDIKEVASSITIKSIGSPTIKGARENASKSSQSRMLTIRGVDENGNTILENDRKETFYVNKLSGDFVYVSISK